MRKCNKCNDELIVGENTTPSSMKYHTYECKLCKKENYQKNKEKILALNKKWRDNNPEYQKEYDGKNKEKRKAYRLKNKEKFEAYKKEYNKKNIESIREYHRKYQREKRKNDIGYRLIQSVMARINLALKTNKTQRTIEYLGCSIPEYKAYLESKFDDNMTWDNHGDYWEIDHIHPLSKGGSFHYTNTQPLPWQENRTKGSKWDPQ